MTKDYALLHGKLRGDLMILSNRVKFGTYSREEISAMLDDLIDYKPERVTAAPVTTAVEVFHQKRGCCDGSNPSACHAYRVEAAKPRELRTPTERRPRDEYYGTNPND